MRYLPLLSIPFLFGLLFAESIQQNGVANLTVSQGGTGATTLTSNGVLIGNGTSAVQSTPAMGNGGLVIGAGTGVVPSTGTLTGTANQVTVTNAAGSITLAAPQNIHTGASPTFTNLTLSGNSFSVGSSTFQVSNGTVSIRGTTLGDNAPAGYLGEFLSQTLSGAQTPAASGSYISIATVTLTAGDWDVTGYGELNTGGTTAATSVTCGISSSNTSLDSNNNNNRTDVAMTFPVSQTEGLKLGPRRVNLTASTAYYTVCTLSYTTLGGATWGVDSIISARRVR